MNKQTADRRPIAARSNQYSQRISKFLARKGISPNTISVASMIFAIGAGYCLVKTSIRPDQRIWWVLIALFIILRLSANMFDGMVAMETGRTTPIGEIFNEIPDRVSDVLIFVCAGYAFGSSLHLGYLSAILALFIAYLRAFGNQMGVSQLFVGPMAKSHRMFTLVAICLLSTIFHIQNFMSWGLWVIITGSVITVVKRLQLISAELSK